MGAVLNLREVECFIAVADELHFGRAARRLHLAQPTVSESIRRLERQIGGPLFDRSTRTVRLTELGGAFLDEAREAYDSMQTAYQKARVMARCPARAFSVGAGSSDEDLVVAATAAFSRALPRTNLQFEEMRTVEQIDAVLHRRIDVGVAWEPPPHAELTSHALGRTEYIAVVAQGHPLARRSAITLGRLAEEPLITWARATNPVLYERFASTMSARGLPWSLVATASGVANLMARVISGQGVGVVPSTALLGRRLHGISLIRIAPSAPVAECALIWSRNAPNLAVATFAKAMQHAWAECRADASNRQQFGLIGTEHDARGVHAEQRQAR
jgi:DNA-binding transcriptional LysR family regulator